MAEVNVHLSGIPLTANGQEVTINFLGASFNNDQTFYTDSNGLAMEKRVLN